MSYFKQILKFEKKLSKHKTKKRKKNISLNKKKTIEWISLKKKTYQ